MIDRTFDVPTDVLHGDYNSTGSDVVRFATNSGYMEFTIKGDYIEVRTCGADLPAITIQAVCGNVVNLYMSKAIFQEQIK